jgi:hypothetical protein
MATKKKGKKRLAKAKRAVSKRVPTVKAGGTPKKSSQRTPKRAVVSEKTIRAKTARVVDKRAREKSNRGDVVPFSAEGSGSRSGEQSGDLQGLSNVERADSESVDELLEEGNAFEAEAVTGVERAEDDGEREVTTHEVPEDDVPGEYLDKDE